MITFHFYPGDPTCSFSRFDRAIDLQIMLTAMKGGAHAHEAEGSIPSPWPMVDGPSPEAWGMFFCAETTSLNLVSNPRSANYDGCGSKRILLRKPEESRHVRDTESPYLVIRQAKRCTKVAWGVGNLHRCSTRRFHPVRIWGPSISGSCFKCSSLFCIETLINSRTSG